MLIRILLMVILSMTVQLSHSTPARGFDECIAESPFKQLPTSKKQRTVKLCRKAYALEYDPNAKLPIWVSYTLQPSETVGCLKRSDSFSRDPDLADEEASDPKDYVKSGYDMGHMANSSDMRWDEQAERESFYLTNMAPQVPSFNRGVWKKLEDSTRGWALSRQHPIHIYVGPIYNREQNPRIGKNGVTVPSAFYKILIDIDTNEAQVYMFKHERSKADLGVFITSLAEVQKQTGVVFPVPKGVTYTSAGWVRDIKSNRDAKAKVCGLTR